MTGAWVPVAVAAKRARRSKRRLYTLIDDGRIDARESSEGWQVYLPSLVAYLADAKPGRPRHAGTEVADNGSNGA